MIVEITTDEPKWLYSTTQQPGAVYCLAIERIDVDTYRYQDRDGLWLGIDGSRIRTVTEVVEKGRLLRWLDTQRHSRDG